MFFLIVCVSFCFVSYLRNMGEKSYSSIFSSKFGLEVLNLLKIDLR